ncbi:MAG: translocation/assembly module TamB domain-containing protein [Marinoscillum sp.]
MKDQTRKTKRIFLKTLKVLGWTIASLFVLFISLVLVVRSEWGQNLIVNKASAFVSKKIDTPFSIDRIFITFTGNAFLEGLYLEDQGGDTLVYSKDLEVSVALLPLIKGETSHVNLVDWSGLVANVYRDSTTSEYNFNYLIEAFAPADTAQTDTTTQSSPTIKIGTVAFENFRLTFDDYQTGMSAKLNLGSLYLDMDELDLEQLYFSVDELTLKNSTFAYLQKQIEKPLNEVSQDTTTTPLPIFKVNQLNIQNVGGAYESIPDQMSFSGRIGEATLDMPTLDLNDNKIEIDEFILNNTTYAMEMYPTNEAHDTTSTIESASAFTWPNWTISANDLSLKDNQISIISDSTTITEGLFNPLALGLTDLSIEIPSFELGNQQASIECDLISFKERSGFGLNDFAVKLSVSEKELKLREFKTITPTNELSGEMSMTYPSIQSLIDSIQTATFQVSLALNNSGIQDLSFFAPSLLKNQALRQIGKKPITLSADGSGPINELNINKVLLSYGKKTHINVSGQVLNAMDSENVGFKNLKYNIRSTDKDLTNLIGLPDSSGISLPAQISFSGKTTGGLQTLTTSNQIKTSDGNISLSGTFKRATGIDLNLKLSTDSLLIGKILGDDQLGALTFNLSAQASGDSLSSLNGTLTSDFKSISYAGYDFSELSLKGSMQDGLGKIDLNYQDNNLDMALNSEIELDSIESRISLFLDLKGADLKSLGITPRDIRTAFQLNASFLGNAETFDADVYLTDAIVVHNQENYRFGQLIIDAHAEPDSTYVDASSELVDLFLASNSSPTTLADAINRKIKSYISQTSIQDTTTGNVEVRMNMAIKQNQLIDEVFLPQLEKYDSITLNLTFLEKQDSISAYFNAPYIDYGGNILDSLRFEMVGSSGTLDFLAGWSHLDAGPLSVDKTLLKGSLQEDGLLVDFNAAHGTDTLIHIGSVITAMGDTVKYHLNPQTLVLNKKPWSIPETNAIYVAPDFLRFESFRLNRNSQEFTLETSQNDEGKQQLMVLLNGFNLSTLTSYLNPEKDLVNGSMEGKVTVDDPFGKSALLADLKILQLKAMDADLGTLTLKGSTGAGSNYDFNLALKEGGADLDLVGQYTPDEVAATMDLRLTINKLETKIFNKLVPESVSEATGYLTGKVDISGPTNEPEYNGSLQFHDVSLLANELNTRFILSNEELRVDNKGLYFNNFSIADADKNQFRLDGTISTEDLTNPKFDLTVKSKNFQAINSTKENNELYYGKVGLNADLTVKGDLNVPIIRGSAGIEKESSFTVIVPESQAALVEKEGIVVFVNKKDPDDILTRKSDQVTNPTAIKGIDLNVQLHVGENSVFKIVINERTGDNFQVSGTGDFVAGLEPNGRTTLSGSYNISDGHFEASLYNLVKRRFEIGPQSTIKWNGDPFEATLDVSAIYKVKTAPAPIMATATSSEEGSATSKYQQKLPFEVYLNLDGTLLQPEISFSLDIPEDERGSLGGGVYSRVQQLNNQEEQLNKQVFSLLVLNRFFPAGGSDGSSGGAASIARDNVNNVLSGQLNTLSDKITGKSGVELDFGLNSYTDYQGETSENRTDLNINASKRLFNDRLVVQVGSEVGIEGSGTQTSEGTPLIGNVSLEYLITEEGRYRFKGFRKNEYESVIDGQLIVTGFAFIFTKEFNKFKDMWKKNAEELENQGNAE